LVIKVRQDKRVINKSFYLALGVNADGKKQRFGIWLSQNEGVKFWLSALTQLKNHGVEAILMACVDGLTGFPEAMNSACPQSSGPALHRPYGFEGNLFCQHR
jgi:putative transposase